MAMPSTSLKIILHLIALGLFPFFPDISFFVWFCMVRWIKFQGRGEVMYTYLILFIGIPFGLRWGGILLSIYFDLPIIGYLLLGLFIAVFIGYLPHLITNLVRFLFRDAEETGEMVLRGIEFVTLSVVWLPSLWRSIKHF